MARKKYHTTKSAHAAYEKIRFDAKVKERRLRALRSQAGNELMKRDTPKRVLRKLYREFKRPHNKKTIAREYGLPYSFIVWLGSNQDEDRP